jgi:hypothetical protein
MTNYICTNNTVTISGETAHFNGTGTVTPAVISLSSRTLGGRSTVTVSTAMNWTGGTMSGSGRTIIPAGVTLNAAIPSLAFLTTRTLENAGTVLWAGAGILGVIGNAVITSRAGALFRVESQTANGLGGGAAAGRFDNAGTFRKSAGTGTTTVAGGLTFNNYGTVDPRSGILAANGGFTVSSSALLNCALGGSALGGGLFGQFTLKNSIVAGNSLAGGSGMPGGSVSGPDVYCSSAISSLGFNLIGQTNNTSGWVASDLAGSTAAPLGPNLGPLQDNGGPTPTIALLPGSPAIDAGDNSLLASIATDQRGQPCLLGVHVDIGAYEAEPQPPLLTATISTLNQDAAITFVIQLSALEPTS